MIYNTESDKFFRFNLVLKQESATVMPHKHTKRLYLVSFAL